MPFKESELNQNSVYQSTAQNMNTQDQVALKKTNSHLVLGDQIQSNRANSKDPPESLTQNNKCSYHCSSLAQSTSLWNLFPSFKKCSGHLCTEITDLGSELDSITSDSGSPGSGSRSSPLPCRHPQSQNASDAEQASNYNSDYKFTSKCIALHYYHVLTICKAMFGPH